MINPTDQHWLAIVRELVTACQPVVMVTVVQVEGSAPRKPGCRMFVMEHKIMATIGGGNLEYEAIRVARRLLRSETGPDYDLELYGLGPALEQCCGGAVTLAFEKITGEPDWLAACEAWREDFRAVLVNEFGDDSVHRNVITDSEAMQVEATSNRLIERLGELRPQVVVFGAGHVGHALVEVLARLPFEIFWVDERKELFPDPVPDGVTACTGVHPVHQIESLPDGALVLVLTHSHALDEEICFKYLKEKDFYFLGLIGSKTKRARFLHRLRDRGIGQDRLARLVCPIGVPQVTGSSPPEIAIAVAAQLLNQRDHIRLDTSLL